MFQKTLENTRCTEKSCVLVKLQLFKKFVKTQSVKVLAYFIFSIQF